jgi:Fur family ferric uptake transcriptional regulator
MIRGPNIMPESKFRITRQRRVILEELHRDSQHPTASEIYELVRRRLPRISLGTVYRNLEMLGEHGLIQKLDVGGTQKRFDGITNNHYHLRCLRCGSVQDAPLEPMMDLEEIVRKRTDFEIEGHRLEFVGLCLKCRTASKHTRR